MGWEEEERNAEQWRGGGGEGVYKIAAWTAQIDPGPTSFGSRLSDGRLRSNDDIVTLRREVETCTIYIQAPGLIFFFFLQKFWRPNTEANAILQLQVQTVLQRGPWWITKLTIVSWNMQRRIYEKEIEKAFGYFDASVPERRQVWWRWRWFKHHKKL